MGHRENNSEEGIDSRAAYVKKSASPKSVIQSHLENLDQGWRDSSAGKVPSTLAKKTHVQVPGNPVAPCWPPQVLHTDATHTPRRRQTSHTQNKQISLLKENLSTLKLYTTFNFTLTANLYKYVYYRCICVIICNLLFTNS